MTTDLFPKTRELIARSARQQELSEFLAWLETERYTAWSIHRHLSWLEQALPRLGSANPGSAHSVEDLRNAFNAEPVFRHVIQAAWRAYCRFLRTHGRLLDDTANDRFAELRNTYHRHLSELRGLSQSTRQHHLLTVTDLLEQVLGACRQLNTLTQDDVERFIARRSKEISRNSMQHLVAHLRAFLRYCWDHGHISTALDVIDTPRTYRGEQPPKALPWATVLALLASIDHRSKAGWRDHCIVHLLAYYGLRPSEVAVLRMDSIDWESGVLHVVQCKTRSELLLPLAPETLQLLRDYLTHDRLRRYPEILELFLRARGPDGPLQRYAISDIFDKRMREANLKCPQHYHVYCLRHTFAMRLLTRGVGVKAIGDVLGHRSLESTCAYLRLDIDMLRGVALDVPTADCAQGGHHA
jgi:integrase/recombinase XerD